MEGVMAKKPQRKNEAEVDEKTVEAVKSSVKFTAPEITKEYSPDDEIKPKDEPVGEVLKAKEIIADKIVYQKDERGIEWKKSSQSDEWSAKHLDVATNEIFQLKKDKDGNETWYTDDGKTKRYTKDKNGNEAWYDALGRVTREKTPNGREKLYVNGVKVADIKWGNDGSGTAYINGIEGECKLTKRKYGGRETDNYVVNNENYTKLEDLEIHKNGGMKTHPGYSSVYRSDGSLESVKMRNGQTYFADKNGRITKSYGSEGKTEYRTGMVSSQHFPPVIANPKKEKTTDEKGNVTYYKEDGWTRSHTVDKKGKTTYYTADGQTIDHTVDKNGKETYYTPDGKVDKDKTKAARTEAKKKTAAVLRADRIVSDKEMKKAMREAIESMAKSGEQEKSMALQQESPSLILQAQRGGRG